VALDASLQFRSVHDRQVDIRDQPQLERPAASPVAAGEEELRFGRLSLHRSETPSGGMQYDSTEDSKVGVSLSSSKSDSAMTIHK
jgi:hypothetical protein